MLSRPFKTLVWITLSLTAWFALQRSGGHHQFSSPPPVLGIPEVRSDSRDEEAAANEEVDATAIGEVNGNQAEASEHAETSAEVKTFTGANQAEISEHAEMSAEVKTVTNSSSSNVVKPPTCVDTDRLNSKLELPVFDGAKFDASTELAKWIAEVRQSAFKDPDNPQKTSGAGCPKRSFMAVNPACGGLGFGNCQIGIMSAIFVAVLTDSIPLIGMRAKLIHDVLKPRHGGWSSADLLPCYKKIADRRKFDPIFKPKKTEALGAVKKLLSRVQSVELKSHQYFGAYALVSPRFRAQLRKVFPAALADSPASFGVYRDIFNSFFEIKPEAKRGTESILDVGRWKVGGPLLVLHLRKGFTSERHPDADASTDALNCLRQVLVCRGLPQVRVFVATYHRATWQKFRSFFGLGYEGGMAQPSSVGGIQAEFKVSDAVNQRQTGTDQKTTSYFHDWYVISQANIVLLQPRTTFSVSAIAMGKPAVVYTYGSNLCKEVFYREVCMHDNTAVRVEAEKSCEDLQSRKSCDTLKKYPDYCADLGS